jgi:stage II sporulation protein M
MNPALDIFIHNEFAGIQTYFLSIFFGIDAFFSIIFNGVLLGAIGGDVNGGSLVYAVAMFLALVVPHGIFEIPATILESVAGVLLFLFIFRFFKTIYTTKDISDFKLKAKNSWNVNKVYLKQSIVLMIFCCLLLVIAAIIEAYITDYVGNWVESFFR